MIRTLVAGFLLAVVGPASAQSGQSVENYPLGAGVPPAVVEQIRTLVSTGGGQVIDDRVNNRLLIMATADQHRRIKQMLQPFITLTPRNIQILVRIVDRGSSSDRGVGVSAQGALVVPQTDRSSGRIQVQAVDRNALTSQNSSQFITVTSGGRGSILVAEEVPYADWFFEYGIRYGYLRAETKWKQVGASLVVEPQIIGDGSWIQVRLTPELSYFVDRQRLTTALVNASTELSIRNGQEMSIAGSTGNQDFYSRFLVGFDSARRTRTVDIVLRPTILQ